MTADKEREEKNKREERNCESELGDVWSIPPTPLIKSVNVTGRLM